METVDLEKQVEMLAKLRERDEAERKKAEREFRAAMQKDTAGQVYAISQYLAAQIAGLQAQIDTHHPVGALARAVDAVAAKLAEIDARLATVEKKQGGEK